MNECKRCGDTMITTRYIHNKNKYVHEQTCPRCGAAVTESVSGERTWTTPLFEVKAK